MIVFWFTNCSKSGKNYVLPFYTSLSHDFTEFFKLQLSNGKSSGDIFSIEKCANQSCCWAHTLTTSNSHSTTLCSLTWTLTWSSIPGRRYQSPFSWSAAWNRKIVCIYQKIETYWDKKIRKNFHLDYSYII